MAMEQAIWNAAGGPKRILIQLFHSAHLTYSVSMHRFIGDPANQPRAHDSLPLTCSLGTASPPCGSQLSNEYSCREGCAHD